MNDNIWFKGRPIIIYPTQYEAKSFPFKRMFNKPGPWNQRIKCKYYSEDGKKLAAGGIFFMEDTSHGKGIWVIKEEDNDKTIYTDFGGKYDHNDGNILATISREFREETYNTKEISYKNIISIPQNHHIYIDGYDGEPVYLCIVVNIKNVDINFDSKNICQEREKIIKENPTITSKWYRTIDISFLLLKDISAEYYNLSGRLTSILKNIKYQRGNFSNEIIDFFKELRI